LQKKEEKMTKQSQFWRCLKQICKKKKLKKEGVGKLQTNGRRVTFGSKNRKNTKIGTRKKENAS